MKTKHEVGRQYHSSTWRKNKSGSYHMVVEVYRIEFPQEYAGSWQWVAGKYAGVEPTLHAAKLAVERSLLTQLRASS